MSTRGEYTIILKKSGNQYVSLCLELMVVSCGGTREEAAKVEKIPKLKVLAYG